MYKSILVSISFLIFTSNLFGQGVWEPRSDFEIRGSPTLIEFDDPYEGFVYLTRDGLINTRDEGQSWSEPSLGEMSMPSLDFLNFNTGWVSGGGWLHYTVDGGENWETGGNIRGNSFRDIDFINEQLGWSSSNYIPFVIGNDREDSAGYISITRDGGQSWEIQFSEFNVGIIGPICFADQENGIANYTGNSLLLTENAGDDWGVIEDLPCFFHDFEHVRDGSYIGLGYIRDDQDGDTGVIARTTDYGNEWEIVWSIEINDNERIVSELSFANE